MFRWLDSKALQNALNDPAIGTVGSVGNTVSGIARTIGAADPAPPFDDPSTCFDVTTWNKITVGAYGNIHYNGVLIADRLLPGGMYPKAGMFAGLDRAAKGNNVIYPIRATELKDRGAVAKDLLLVTYSHTGLFSSLWGALTGLFAEQDPLTYLLLAPAVQDGKQIKSWWFSKWTMNGKLVETGAVEELADLAGGIFSNESLESGYFGLPESFRTAWETRFGGSWSVPGWVIDAGVNPGEASELLREGLTPYVKAAKEAGRSVLDALPWVAGAIAVGGAVWVGSQVRAYMAHKAYNTEL